MERQAFIELAEKLATLHEKKSHDYGTEMNYFPFGDRSYVQMLHLKVQRLVELTNTNKEPNYESIQDTLLDLLNYSFFYHDYLRNQS